MLNLSDYLALSALVVGAYTLYLYLTKGEFIPITLILRYESLSYLGMMFLLSLFFTGLPPRSMSMGSLLNPSSLLSFAQRAAMDVVDQITTMKTIGNFQRNISAVLF
jgi:hypothetical protein